MLSKEYYKFRIKVAFFKALFWWIYIILIDIVFISVYLIKPIVSIFILILLLAVGISLIIFHNCYIKWYYEKYIQNYDYQITKDEIIIREGVFRHYESRVPFSRIQNIGITQNFWEKRYGWYKALIQTAGGVIRMGHFAEGCIIGIRDPYPIQQLILERSKRYLNTRITGLEETVAFEGTSLENNKKFNLNYNEYNMQLGEIIFFLNEILINILKKSIKE